MASQLLGIKTRFTNDLGSPLVGGQVYTYFAGTSTNQDTYSDADLTIPNTNPVILDDTGSADIFLKGAYRIRVFDRKGKFVEEQDNVDQLATVAEVFKNKGGLNAANERIDALTSEVNSVKEKTLIFEDGVIADTFVTKTANGVGQVARNQRDKNTDILTVKDFGVVGSFNTDTLAERFDTLTEAQAQYPNAIALTEIADRVALDAFLLHLISNRVDGADWSCEVLLDKPLVSYKDAKTLLINGDLVMKPAVGGIKYMLHIATDYLKTTGRIDIKGEQPAFTNMMTRLSYFGVVLGTFEKLGLTGTAANCDLSLIQGNSMLGFVYTLGANCHFTKIGFVRSSRCGSYVEGGTYPQQSGVVDSVVSHVTTGSVLTQKTELTISSTKITSEVYNLLDLTAFINGRPYQVLSLDIPNNKLSVYPQIPSEEVVTKVLYIFGGAVNVISNNTACTSIGTLQSITSGSGLRIPALYGISISSFISEYNGAALLISRRGEAHLGTSILQAYFEANNADIIYGGSLVDYSALTISNSIALNKNKIWNMLSYVMSNGSMRSDWAALGSGYINIDGALLGKDKNVLSLHETTHNSLELIGSTSGAVRKVQLIYDQKIAELTQRYSKTINFAIEFGAPPLSIEPPTGYTINNSTSLDIPLQEYEGFVSVTFHVKTEIDAKNITAYVVGIRKVKKGTTANRPTSPTIGLRYYDTTLLASGKPIEWNGIAWVDSTGVTV